MRIDIITIFPKVFESYFNETIIRRAIKNKHLQINIVDLRKYAKRGDTHKSVDDRPYGGGPGMILMVEPIVKALRAIGSSKFQATNSKKKTRVIMLTPKGKRFTQKDGQRLSAYKRVVLLCGRYEGFDARVEKYVDEKISIGDYVLAGGELPAMVVTEVIARHIPGVVGHKEALKEETFSKGKDYIEYPQYTRPEVFYPKGTEKQKNRETEKRKRGLRVPKVLLSGNHADIKAWRDKKSKK